MRGTIQNKVDKETRFNNEFGQFVAEPGEALHEWLKYVTQVRLAKRLKEDSYDDLFDYLSQYEKLVNTSRAKKLEKSYDPLALVAQTGSSTRIPSPYYVTHPSSVVDYDDDYQGMHFKTILKIHLFLNTRRSFVPEEIIEDNNDQNDVGNIQRTLRTTSSGSFANVQCYNCSEKGHYARNCPKPKVQDSKYFKEQMLLAKQDEAGVTLTDEQNDFLFADTTRMEEIEELTSPTSGESPATSGHPLPSLPPSKSSPTADVPSTTSLPPHHPISLHSQNHHHITSPSSSPTTVAPTVGVTTPSSTSPSLRHKHLSTVTTLTPVTSPQRPQHLLSITISLPSLPSSYEHHHLVVALPRQNHHHHSYCAPSSWLLPPQQSRPPPP
nr:hypothetical protein [Tanacetum cinerariifolium]